MPSRSPFDTDERRRARGERIRWAREIVEPNRLDFARKLVVDAATIRDIENGRINPAIQVLYAICHSLRISLEYIVEGLLTGIDPELLAVLCSNHPELLANQRTTRASGTQDTDRRASTYPTSTAVYMYR